MKLKNVAAAGALVVATAIALTACSGGGSTGSSSSAKPSASASSSSTTDYSSLSGTITSGGSSAQANAEGAWMAAFKTMASGVTVNYDKSQGSGGGVTNWLTGTYDFAGSDAALSAAQETQAQTNCGSGGALNIPVYLSGVAIIYNLPGVTSLKLSSKAIAEIFSRKITTWNAPDIAASNPGVTLPATAITVVTRSDGSGTTNNFTNYLSQTQPSIWTYPPSTAFPTAIAGVSGQQGGTGVVTAVTSGSGTIGYADHSSIASAHAADVQVGTGSTYVTYSQAGATAAFAAAKNTVPSVTGDLTQDLKYTNITSSSAYPIPLLSYGIVCTTLKSATQAKLVKAYLGFVTSSLGQRIAAKNAGSAPLPSSIQSEAASSLARIK